MFRGHIFVLHYTINIYNLNSSNFRFIRSWDYSDAEASIILSVILVNRRGIS